jgi:carbamoyl-phosphate synthase large subunit
MNVIVTGVGAVIGHGIVAALRLHHEPVTIVGVDRNPEANGRHRCDNFEPKPADQSELAYRDFWHELVDSCGAELVIPGIEQDVFYFDEHRGELDVCHVVLNSPEAIEAGRDKWAAVQRLSGTGVDIIPSMVSGSWDEALEALGPAPLLMKPRRGSGGQGMVQLEDAADFDYWQQKASDNFMVQRVVGSDDEEYTVSVFGLGGGEATPAAIMRRRLGPGGATWWAESVAEHAAIERAVAVLNRELQPDGPTNYQFRVAGDKAYLLEVNPRISASTSMRAALGVNEPGMCIDHYIRGRDVGSARLRPGEAWRFIQDEVRVR